MREQLIREGSRSFRLRVCRAQILSRRASLADPALGIEEGTQLPRFDHRVLLQERPASTDPMGCRKSTSPRSAGPTPAGNRRTSWRWPSRVNDFMCGLFPRASASVWVDFQGWECGRLWGKNDLMRIGGRRTSFVAGNLLPAPGTSSRTRKLEPRTAFPARSLGGPARKPTTDGPPSGLGVMSENERPAKGPPVRCWVKGPELRLPSATFNSGKHCHGRVLLIASSDLSDLRH